MSKLEMTVEEAGCKICPFQGNMIDAFCIGDKCMAWVSSEDKQSSTEWLEWNEKRKIAFNQASRHIMNDRSLDPFDLGWTADKQIAYEVVREAWLKKFPKPPKYSTDPSKDIGYCARIPV